MSSLRTKNTCPTCRAEIEPSRNTVLQPLTATVAAEIIQNEERDIDIARRISVINAFTDTNGRAGMIISLCRELAFGAAHSLAGWQGTSEETYHASWREYEYNNYSSSSSESGSDLDSESDSDLDSESGSESESESEVSQRLDQEPENIGSVAAVSSVNGEITETEPIAECNPTTLPHVIETDVAADTETEGDSVIYTTLVIRAAVTSVTYLMAVTLVTVIVNVY